MSLVFSQTAFFRLRAALAAFLLVIAVAPARAQTPSSALNGLLNDLRAQGAEISFDRTSPGPRDGDIRLANLTLVLSRENAGGLTLNFSTLDLSGVRSDKARVSIEQARGERILATVNGAALSIAHLTARRLLLPRGGESGKGQGPFQSLVAALRQVVAAEFQQIALDEINWKPPSGPALSAARIEADDFLDGNVARIVIANPRRVEAASDRIVAADEIAIKNFNPRRIVDCLDFRKDAAREWASFAEAVDVNGYSDAQAGARAAIEKISLSGARARRVAGESEKFFDLAAASPAYFSDHPDEGRRFGAALMDMVRLDRLSATKLTATDGKTPPRLSSFESLAIDGLDFHGAAAITLDDFQDRRGANGFSIRQAAIARLELPMNDGAPADGGAQTNIPFVGGVSIHDAKLDQPGGAFALRAFEWSAADRVGVFPTTLHAKISGLSLPPAIAPDPGLRASLMKSGVNALMLDADLSASWDSVLERILLDHAEIDVNPLGRVELAGTFVGAPKDAFRSPQKLQAALWAGSLTGLKLKFTDSGLSNRVIGAIAEANKHTPEQIRAALTTNMPTLLGAIPDSYARNALIFALVGHLNNPGTLELTSLAQAPIPVAELAAALKSPSALPGLLKLDAKATPTKCLVGSTKACRDESAIPN